MRSTACNATDGMSEEMPAPNPVYTAALQAACLNLSAQASDLRCLLDPVHAMQVAPQQISGLLKQLWSRLEALRASQAEVTGAAAQHPELARTLEQAFSYLHPGDTFSLADAYTEFEQAYQTSIEVGSPAESVATVRETQAQIAAVQRDYRGAASLYAEASATPGLNAPLQWRYQLQRALTLEDLGREGMDDAALEAALSLYETELLALAPQAERPDDWATTQHNFGNALGAVGQRQRGTWMLEKSIMAFESALTVRTRERSPLDWSATQNSLGVTLGILAQRHADTEMLGKSVEAFQLALEVRTQDRSPHDWAVTQNNLGAALRALGQRKQDRTLLKQASESYKNVLQVWTRACVPLEWAATMDNLGTALRLLGEHRNGPRTLEQAVAAFRSALAERTRANVPQAWAMTQNNLGAALHKLGERQHDAQPLEAAVEAYDNALKEWTRERVPMTWAMTLANQCATRKALAELVGDAEIAHQALTDFRAVAEVFREASHAQYYELVTEQVALTQKLEQTLLNGETASERSDVAVSG